MKKTILLFFALGLFACQTKEQDNKIVQDQLPSDQLVSLPQNDSLAQFPKDWEGRYEGEMHWYVNGKLRGKIPCRHEVLLQKPGIWSWKTTYDSTQILPQTVVKDYLLLEDKSQPQGHFILDEQDGILLDMILMGNSFYSQFEVNGSRINTIDRLEGNLLHKEIVMTAKDKVRKSSAQTGKETFEVKSASSIVVQRAILKRQE